MKGIYNEFKEFALRGSVVDLAVGVIIGAAFNAVVKSLVSDIITPPIGYIFGVDFANLFYTLGGAHYGTLAQAEKAGAGTINYGIFINTLISFFVMAVAIFFLIKGINRLRRRRDTGEDTAPTTKPCQFCMSEIPLAATRCPNCTSQLSKETKTKKA